jgi:hypothetical protein
MCKLKQGKSYLWALPFVWGGMALSALASVATTGNLEWGVRAVPFAIVAFTVFEIWSGVALDSWWHASHPRGTAPYYGLIAWQLFVSAAFTYALMTFK